MAGSSQLNGILRAMARTIVRRAEIPK